MRASSGWWGVRSIAKGLAAVLAALTLVVTGYGWVQLHGLTGGRSRANVMESVGSDADQNILLVGLDTRTDAHGEPLPAELLSRLHAGDSGSGGDSADTLIVVHIAAGGRSATAISIPRDSYVQLADGLGQHKINSAYAYGKNAALARVGVDRPSGGQQRAAGLAGTQLLVDTVESLTGLRIAHYATLNLAGFYLLSQAVGGVPVCLRAPVHDSYTGLDLPAGRSMISGEQALAFVRQRHGLPQGDLDRIHRQQVFLAALAHQMLSSGVLTNPLAVARLASALRTSLTVDTGFDLLAVAEELRRIDAGQVIFRTIPTEDPALRTPDGLAVQVDPGQVESFVSEQTTHPAVGSRSPIDRSDQPPVTAVDPSCTN